MIEMTEIIPYETREITFEQIQYAIELAFHGTDYEPCDRSKMKALLGADIEDVVELQAREKSGFDVSRGVSIDIAQAKVTYYHDDSLESLCVLVGKWGNDETLFIDVDNQVISIDGVSNEEAEELFRSGSIEKYFKTRATQALSAVTTIV